MGPGRNLLHKRQIACGQIPRYAARRTRLSPSPLPQDSQPNLDVAVSSNNNQMHVSTGVSSASVVVLPAEQVLAKGLHKSAPFRAAFGLLCCSKSGARQQWLRFFKVLWPTFSRGPQFPLFNGKSSVLHFHWLIPYFFYNTQPRLCIPVVG